MQLTLTASVGARCSHRVEGSIHTHDWTLEATVEGPDDAAMVHDADDLERVLLNAVRPWEGHYLTASDVGVWKGQHPIVWDIEPTIEAIALQLWTSTVKEVPHLVELALVEKTSRTTRRTVRVSS